MNREYDETGYCAVCRRDTEGARWFCHFYTDDRCDTLCSPKCAEVFLHRPPDSGRAEEPAAPAWESAMAIEVR